MSILPAECGQGDRFMQFRKDIYFTEYLNSLGLNNRQVKAVLHVKEKGKITNREYQSLYSVSKATATRDLSELENRQLLVKERRGLVLFMYYLEQCMEMQLEET